MHSDNNVRTRHGNDGRARRRGRVPVTTSIESSIAGSKECAFESRVVEDRTVGVVAAVVYDLVPLEVVNRPSFFSFLSLLVSGSASLLRPMVSS